MTAPTPDGESWHSRPSGIAHPGTVPTEFVERFGEGLARMVNGESTSAALRRTQEALAASQADLTAAEARHRVLWDLERDACVKLRQQLLVTEAELTSAIAELELLRKGGVK